MSILMKPAIAQPPVLLWEPGAYITFRHPGYESPSDILFRLPRLDLSPRTTSSSTPREVTEPRVWSDHGSLVDTRLQEQRTYSGQESVVVGVHHRTALLACQIIANNAFDGYLSTDREGQKQVTIEGDGVLLADSYWFIANRSVHSRNQVRDRDVYPIVPSFQDWAFPHQHFAALGWETHPSTRLRQRAGSTAVEHTMPIDNAAVPAPVPVSISAPLAPPPRPQPNVHRCILTYSSYSLEKAHIIPGAQKRWFGDNVMATYGRSSRTVDDEGNKVHMRHDLHSVWDDHNFALVPKGGDFAIHVLNMPDPGIMEFAATWHNVPVQKDALAHAAGEYFFGKFAQAVFMLLKPFIVQSAVHRFVARMKVQTDDPRHARELKEEWVSGNSLSDSYSGGGSKSASPSASRKRSRSQASIDPGNHRSVDCDSGKDNPDSTWYERSVRPGFCASDSEGEREAGWYSINVGVGKSDSEEDGATKRGRSRSRNQRQCRQRQRSEHTVDTLPSLTDTSVVGLIDVDRSFEDTTVPLPPLYKYTDGQIKGLADEEDTKDVCDQDPA
ncbi:hypothetical protein VM1G_10877 [Cytospora mali]|uniref:HNH nuclease domain-containing protein n=1 Tax=Cytospora mali TaxID=578113 RepID=A0A194VJE9_CYTMA|nr:hypothetical protein VM1G_10877 [Valsa mali]